MVYYCISTKCSYNYVYVTEYLRNPVFDAHNSKIQFSPSHDSCTQWLMYQADINAES